MNEVLSVQLRESRGKRNNRRLRASGTIPAVLYGHGKEVVCLAISGEEIGTAVRHGVRLVQLTGAVDEQAFIRELQWDTWGTDVLHVDLTRVSAHERVEVVVGIELRGEAPGIKVGGVIEQLLQQISVECEVSDIPDKISVNINELNLDEAITAGELTLSKTAKILCSADTPVVQCVMPTEEVEEEATAVEVEPEVIGRAAEGEANED